MKSHQLTTILKGKLSESSNYFSSLLLTFLIILTSMILFAQKDSKKEEPDEFYGKGGKKETKTFVYPDGVKQETVRFFDPGGRVRQYKQTTTKKDGSTVEEHISYDCDGKKTDSELIKKDANGDVEYYRAEKYANGKDNEIIEGYLSEKNENGEIEISNFNPKSGKYEKVGKSDPRPTKPTFEQDRSTCPLQENKIEIFGGYSYLLANFEPENEGLSGWAISAFYNLNRRWSVGLFTSGHYKSPENQKFSMYFFHGALKYDFVSRDQSQRRFNPYISLGLGIATYKSEVAIPGFPKFESEDKSFSPGFSAGFDFEALKKMYLNADIGYLPTNFQDQTQHNFRISAGVSIGVFRARRDFSSGE